MRRLRLIAGVLAVIVCVAVQADSDGSYCAGASYLAYELREPNDRHTLHIVNAQTATSVELPDFQVHRMRCGSSSVDLAGWHAIYTVDFSSQPARVKIEPLQRAGDLPRWPTQDLGRLNQTARDSGTAMIDLGWSKVTITITQTEPCEAKLRTILQTPAAMRTLIERDIGVECGE